MAEMLQEEIVALAESVISHIKMDMLSKDLRVYVCSANFKNFLKIELCNFLNRLVKTFPNSGKYQKIVISLS